MRSRTPTTRSRVTNGSGLVIHVTCLISSPERPSTRPMARMISVVSSKPLVVIRPTLQPLRVISALVATVLPCLKSVVRPSNSEISTPTAPAASLTASITPREKSSGVVDAFAVQTSPAPPSTTTSVNVPPVSTPIMYCAFDAMLSFPLLYYYTREFSRLAQIFRAPKTPRIRILLPPRRQDAKRQAQGLSSRANARDLRGRFLALLETRISLFVRNDNAHPFLLCVFSGDIPNFGCRVAALCLMR